MLFCLFETISYYAEFNDNRVKELVYRLELGEAELFSDVFPYHLNGHITLNLLRLASHYIGEQVWSLLQFYDSGYIGDVISEGLVVGLAIDGEGINLSLATGYYPFRII